MIAANVALKVQSGDPDYQGMSREEAERDFRKRIEQYERVYQTLTEPSISYCQILNVGKQVTINRIEGYLQSRIAFYLMNLHLKPRNIFLSRVGVNRDRADDSTVRVCTTSRARLAETRICHRKDSSMPRPCRISSLRTLAVDP